jgi:hypothetical protein
MKAKREQQMEHLRSKLSKALVQVEQMRAGKRKRPTLTEVVNAAMSRSA